jgi:hypothetical protein
MAKLIYDMEDSNCREASVISFDVPDDMDVFEFKIMCRRLAAALGYTDVSIVRAFGEHDE